MLAGKLPHKNTKSVAGSEFTTVGEIGLEYENKYQHT
jgi:hypothetical protein